jgi:hypothetical protein
VICGLLLGAGCIVVGYVAVRAGLAAAHRDTNVDDGVRDDDDGSFWLAQGVAR